MMWRRAERLIFLESLRCEIRFNNFFQPVMQKLPERRRGNSRTRCSHISSLDRVSDGSRSSSVRTTYSGTCLIKVLTVASPAFGLRRENLHDCLADDRLRRFGHWISLTVNMANSMACRQFESSVRVPLSQCPSSDSAARRLDFHENTSGTTVGVVKPRVRDRTATGEFGGARPHD